MKEFDEEKEFGEPVLPELRKKKKKKHHHKVEINENKNKIFPIPSRADEAAAIAETSEEKTEDLEANDKESKPTTNPAVAFLNKNKIPLIIVGVILLIVASGVAYYFLSGGKQEKKSAIKENLRAEIVQEDENGELDQRGMEINRRLGELQNTRPRIENDITLMQKQLKSMMTPSSINATEDDAQAQQETFGDLNHAFESSEAKQIKMHRLKTNLTQAIGAHKAMLQEFQSLQQELKMIQSFRKR